MTPKYGIKISRTGKDVYTAKPHELAFSSEYKTLKIDSFGSGTLTDGSRSVTIPHNLGYKPFYFVHTTLPSSFLGGSLFAAGEYMLTPTGGGFGSTSEADFIRSYVDATNLYISAGANIGYNFAYPSSSNDMGSKASFPWATSFAGCGVFADGTQIESSIRVTNVQIPQGFSIISAQLFVYPNFIYNGGVAIKMTVHGYDEDNTSDFSSDPTGRSLTSAVYNHNRTITVNQYFGLDVTDIVQEIINRGGWASGNAIGFRIQDNGTVAGSDHYWEDDYAGVHSTDAYLSVLLSNTVADYKYTIFKNQLE